MQQTHAVFDELAQYGSKPFINLIGFTLILKQEISGMELQIVL